MNRKIIDTNNIANEIPKLKTWYRLNNEIIFVSVIYPDTSKISSHFRRKSEPNSNRNKKDNEMCFWHSNWQFSLIESRYGLPANKERTYEITVSYENEHHRIDSVVENIALEFQHSLGVSRNEMNSRYEAHKACGYIPYLVLDFTDFDAEQTILAIQDFKMSKIDSYIKEYSESILKLPFLKKIRKWMDVEYARNSKIFIDFGNLIVRLILNGVNSNYTYERDYFIENILNLEIILRQGEEKAKEDKIRRKEKERLRLEEYHRQEKEDKIYQNRRDLISSDDYRYYRKCEANKHIDNIIKETFGTPEYVNYRLIQGEYFDKYRKIHIYQLFKSIDDSPLLEIQYTVIGSYQDKKYSFFQSNIDVIKRTGINNTGIRRLSLIQKPKEKMQLISITNEIAKDYLHSLDGFALFSYDENEKLEKREYYIFNKKVTKDIYLSLQDYFSKMGYFEIENKEAKELIDNIFSVDKYVGGFATGFIQNYVPEEKIEQYYKDIDEQMPFKNIIFID